MPPFLPPQLTHDKDKAWVKVAKPEFRDPSTLWTRHWQQFNTITIPVLDEDAFFADAVTAARQAQSAVQLEELLAAKSQERRHDLENLVRHLARSALDSRVRFPSEETRDAALKTGQTGSLDSFLQLICSIIYGEEDGGSRDSLVSLPIGAAKSSTDDHADIESPNDGDQDTTSDGCAACGTHDVEERTPYNEEDASIELQNTFPPELFNLADDFGHGIQRTASGGNLSKAGVNSEPKLSTVGSCNVSYGLEDVEPKTQPEGMVVGTSTQECLDISPKLPRVHTPPPASRQQHQRSTTLPPVNGAGPHLCSTTGVHGSPASCSLALSPATSSPTSWGLPETPSSGDGARVSTASSFGEDVILTGSPVRHNSPSHQSGKRRWHDDVAGGDNLERTRKRQRGEVR
ncbi:hypothetical protein EsH8_XIV_000031 [Colletotrichum jinshuiense]